MNRVGLIVCLAFSVTGCATYYWVKPGTSQQQSEYDRAVCAAEAQALLPPAMAQYQIGQGYVNPSYTTCTGGYYTANCVSTGGGYTPPTVVPIDMNASVRNSAIEACLYRLGYKKVSGEYLEEIRAGLAQRPQQPISTGGSIQRATTPEYDQCMDICKATGADLGVCWRQCSGTTNRQVR